MSLYGELGWIKHGSSAGYLMQLSKGIDVPASSDERAAILHTLLNQTSDLSIVLVSNVSVLVSLEVF